MSQEDMGKLVSGEVGIHLVDQGAGAADLGRCSAIGGSAQHDCASLVEPEPGGSLGRTLPGPRP